MDTENERQAIIDQEHLRLLPLGYWVSAGFWGAYGLFMIAYFAMIGLVFSTIPAGRGGDAPPAEIGWIFLGFAVIGFIVLAALVALKIYVGFWLRQRTHYVATLVVAGITCLEIPYGTLVGVLTFIALARPSVRALYPGAKAAPLAPVPAADSVASVDEVVGDDSGA